MTALADEYIAAYAADRALNLSNPSEPNAASNDLARIEKAALAAIRDFELIVGISFDSTNQEHLTACVDGVDGWLIKRSPSMTKDGVSLPEWRKGLEAERLRTSAAAIVPKTASNYTPSTEPIGRPPLDDVSFERLRMRSPRSSPQNNSRDW